MKSKLIINILKKDRSVRELIDEACRLSEDEGSIDLGDDSLEAELDAETGIEPVAGKRADQPTLPSDEEPYRHLFVRRWREGADAPYKRSKCDGAGQAIDLFFNWADQYKKEKVEIWTDAAQDAKNFYRYVLKNREQLEPLWKGSLRVKKTGLLWPAAYREIMAKSKQSGTNLVGSLSPFVVDIQK